jgi:hypothetical protein
MNDLTAEATLQFASLSLGELEATMKLQRRIDRKYVVSRALVERILPALSGSYAALEIDGERSFEYHTVYFDTGSLLTYKAHVQRRRRRFKCRSRHYVQSGMHQFEVKLKGRRGETVKERLASDPEGHGTLTGSTHAFLVDSLQRHYGIDLADELRPTMQVHYRRITLGSVNPAERLTLDFDLRFASANGAVAAMSRDVAILESKSLRGRGAADRQLSAFGVRPIACSKYCLGITLTRPADVRGNDFLWLARRHFEIGGY